VAGTNHHKEVDRDTMKLYEANYYRAGVALAVKGLAAVLLIVMLGGCAGGSLLSPRPMNGRDRLVFRVVDAGTNTTYYTRNVWYDGDNYRFHDNYGRDISVAKSDQVTLDIISAAEYYETP
jgi:hypothetical protein